MTPKERLQRILAQQKTDRPACICPGGMMNMATRDLMAQSGSFLPQAHTDSRKMAALAKSAYENGCFENAGVPFCMTVESEAMGAPVALGNEEIEPRVTGYVLQSVTEWQSLPAMDLGAGRCAVVLDAIGILCRDCPDLPVVGNLTGPVSVATSLLEPMVFYRELRKKAEDAHRYMAFVTDQLVRFGLAQIEAGAQVITVSDPSATGEILGPKHFEEFALPYINRIVDALKAAGAQVIVHICGQMRDVFAQVAEIRSDALSFDAVVPMSEARRMMPNRVLMGNVSTYALEFSDADKIKKLTHTCRAGGANILAPACGLGMRSPIQNLQAMRQAVATMEE